MDKSVQITLIVVAGFVILGILGFMALENANNPYEDNTLSVNGNGKVDASPDLVVVYFNIETKGDTSKAASDSNTEIYNDLKSSLMALGFSEDEIQTQSYSVNPNYVWENNQNKQEGYIATHQVKVEFSIEDKEKISDVIDSGVDSGAGISYVSFELSQELQSQYKAEAIEMASKDAKSKAEALANGLDKSVGKLVSVSLDDYYYYPFRAYDSAVSGSAGAEVIKESANITPSTQEVTASVTAVFRIN